MEADKDNINNPEWWVPPVNDEDAHKGCLTCGGTAKILHLDTKLYNECGNWRITKDGKLYFIEELNKGDTEGWNSIKNLNEIELEAQQDPDHDWRAIFDFMLKGGQYQRHGVDKWILIESNQGFA